MTGEMIALARRAVECRGWRWMPGMDALSYGREDGIAKLRLHDVSRSNTGTVLRGGVIEWRERSDGKWLSIHGGDVIGKPSDALPDLTDPATLGCLLALVREAMSDQHICVCWDFVNELWVCEGKFEYNGKKYLGLIKEAQTYAEALVVTLETAPCGR